MDAIWSRQKGWRRTAVISTASTLCFISRGDSDLFSTATIYKGDCQTTKVVNSVLHLLLNLISSLILASSRFFMQILSSPSRKEVDRAHSQLRSLDIGVSSLKNLLFLSPIKTVAWMVLLISSVPIHLFFNSSVFETDFQGSDWRLTIATDSFSTNKVAFFPPGVSLGNSKYWYNITAQDCLAEYASCKPKRNYRDVVIVVDTGTDNPDGWTQSEVFDGSFDSLGSTRISPMPPDDLNSLWFSAQCATYLPTAPVKTEDQRAAICIATCGLALGLGNTGLLTNISSSSTSGWTINTHTPPWCDINNQAKLGHKGINALNVRYCLAEPSPVYVCRVGLANTLLLATIVCVFWKVVTFTPGDALASFISDPDPITLGLGTFDISDSHRLQFEPRIFCESELGHPADLSNTVQPRYWHRKANRLVSAIPKSSWSSTFAPIIFFLAIGGYYSHLLRIHSVLTRYTSDGTLGVSGLPYFVTHFLRKNAHFITLLYANAPQLILSYCFFSYNNLFTRYLHEFQENYLLTGDWGVIEGAMVVLGYSPRGIFAFLLLSSILSMIPILYSFRKLPGDMVVGACDSLVLSAACHPYISPHTVGLEHSNTMNNLISEVGDMSGAYEKALLREISRGRLRWGVTHLPPKLGSMVDTRQDIMHLSLVSEDDYLHEPINGSLYA
ncbi:hypothetical protein F5Y04DRAFT_273865 [Hypomontagnella monticulosa]|nr:hypothetical protein F5Y04DRAFT_273865 [Hypomontagnella monticulosa]